MKLDDLKENTVYSLNSKEVVFMFISHTTGKAIFYPVGETSMMKISKINIEKKQKS